MSASLLSRRNILAALGFAAIASAAPTLAVAAPAAGQWVLLGSERVGIRPDRDVIVVGRDEGRFDRLMLKVHGNDIRIGDIKVIYGNGQVEHLDVREHIRAGEATQPFHVTGRHRVIDRIELLYQSEHRWRGQATVEVYGQLAAVGGMPEPVHGWQVLGTHTVNFSLDRDSILVGVDRGSFRSLRLDVRDHDIFLHNASVTFGNGEVQNLSLHGLLRGGSSSNEIALGGARGRRIERIDLTYRTRPGFHGRAHVAVLGRQ